MVARWGSRPAQGGGWALRSAPATLVRRYLTEGWWDNETLGVTVAKGLERLGAATFRVRSKVRPWAGTFADVDRAARALAGALRGAGVGPGDVVMFQLPNWVEAGVTFWAAAYLGAVVVPVVHFYGPKEVDYILRAIAPAVVVTADRFGHNDYLATYADLLPAARDPVAGGGRPGPTARFPPGAPFASMLGARPARRPRCRSTRRSGHHRLHLGHDPRPQRRRPLAPDHRVRDPPARLHVPQGGPPNITGAPVGHFIGMLNAFLVPLLRDRPVNLIDVWDPGEVLRHDARRGTQRAAAARPTS